MLPREFALSQVFTFLFVMIGPIKLLAPFAKLTHNSDAKFRFQLALRAALFGAAGLLVAAILGVSTLEKWGVSPGALMIAAGVTFFMVSLQNILQSYNPPQPPQEHETTLRMAMMPLAFPTIVPPFGIAAVIFLLATSDNSEYKRNVLLVAVAVMLMNFVAMLLARPIIKYAAFPLALFGAVLGVLQVALSISIIFFGLRLLGVLPAAPQ